jgi:DNA-binding PadR family transcriptional regulator
VRYITSIEPAPERVGLQVIEKSMDDKTLCLGVLTEGDKTGYEIKHCFEEAFSHFFGASFGSIYPALAELSRQGLVTCESVEQDKRPDKKVYSLTERGHRVLLEDLLTTPPRHKVRSEFLALMYFAHLLPPERVGAIIDQMVAHWEPLVAEIERCAAGEDCEIAPTPGMRFAAGYGRAVLGAALAYVRESKGELMRAVGEHQAEPMALAGE